MQRYLLVLGGTAAGVAGVLAFPTHPAKLKLPSAAATTSGGGRSTTAPGASASPSTTAPATKSSPTSTGKTSSGGSTSSSGPRSATSADEQYPYGDLKVKVTVSGTKIVNVSIPTLNDFDGRSASIDNYALPLLEQQVISANSINIDGVSGATFTSQAFVNGMADALQKLGFRV